jgi:malonate decarboxylase alpha subunit
MPTWQHRRDARNCRIEAGAKLASGKIVEVHNATRLMEAVVFLGLTSPSNPTI